MTETEAKYSLSVDAINGSFAGLIDAYCSVIIMDFNREVLAKNLNPAALSATSNIQVTTNYCITRS